ncbi:hypothetical protein LZD49_32685 [Dyadobacter sp. CY261]|uniref:hypothetical protein n=1 Tax=Dyadobacter sp. CY261 TaxID=2907203 RepID=UPI001F289099|nr:hypothetical protein [Dyadobacter sp. CY261]MCF0075283.1 hypothetical protein [Dyadobacter sp. CY261]
MEQGYVLEWLDRAVNQFNPAQAQFANFEDYRFQAFSEEVREEKARQISYLKKLTFQYPKKRKFQEVLDSYFGALNSLIDNAEFNLSLIPDESVILKRAMELVVANLADIHAFILERYSVSLDPDVPLRKYHLAAPNPDFAQLANSNLFVSSPLLVSLLSNEFTKAFYADNLANISSRQVEYWKGLNELISGSQGRNVGDEYFCNVELLLIERNFNSTKFVRYLTDRIKSEIEGLAFGDIRIKKLAYIQKLFNQIPVIKGLAYDRQYDDLSLTINNWFIREIEFRSQGNTENINQSPATATKSYGYIKKSANKILCKLTIDQLALFFKAADMSNIITARSLSAVFQSVAPYLSTQHRAEISYSSLRVKSYSVEERDKSLLLEMMIRLTEQIKDL